MRPSPSLFLRIRSKLTQSRPDAPPSPVPIQKSIEAAYYRGGTSRAVIIQPQNLPTERAKWPSIFRQIMGSGDPYGRQLDGMGAGISSLSKICLVEPYGKRIVNAEQALEVHTRQGGSDATQASAEAVKAQEEEKLSGDEQELDIDYTFVGLGIENDEVDVAGNCGNMSSAIGPYAYNTGLLPPRLYAQGDGKVTVKIRNTNTGKLIDSTFEVADGQAAVAGDYKIDGVTGPGSKIKLDFKHPYGSKTGKVLPTGKRIDHIAGYRVTCVDGANPAIFVRADDIGVDGTILPNDFNKLPDKLALLERIRKAAAVAMGIATTEDLVPRTIPKIGLVSQSSSHAVLSGQTLKTAQMDIVIRFLSDTQPHRAIPLTAALTTAVAARIPGTIVEQMLAPDPVMENAITIGHASGRLQVNATMDGKNRVRPVSATVYRTAKRLFEGNIFWADRGKTDEEANTMYGSSGAHSLGLAFVLENRGKDSLHLFDQDAEQESEQQPQSQLSYRPRLKPPTDTASSAQPEHPPTDTASSAQPEHPSTELTTTLQKLHTQLTAILKDPNLASLEYPPKVITTLEDSFEKLLASTRAGLPVEHGNKWHHWAKALHKRNKGLRHAAKKNEALEQKINKGVTRTTRKEVGLDRYANAAWEETAVKRERKRKAAMEMEEKSKGDRGMSNP